MLPSLILKVLKASSLLQVLSSVTLPSLDPLAPLPATSCRRPLTQKPLSHTHIATARRPFPDDRYLAIARFQSVHITCGGRKGIWAKGEDGFRVLTSPASLTGQRGYIGDDVLWRDAATHIFLGTNLNCRRFSALRSPRYNNFC